MSIVLVADAGDSWLGSFEGVQRMDPNQYLTSSDWNLRRRTKVYNLSRSYAYQSTGYYVSLLAEARGQRPIPDVMTIEDLRGSSAIRLVPQPLEDLIQSSLAALSTEEFTLSVYFGFNLAKKYDRLSRELYGVFHAPLLRFRFGRRNTKWRLRRATAIALSDIPVSHREFVNQVASKHFSNRVNIKRLQKATRYDLAILHNPAEGDLAPSDPTALKRFLKAATRCGIAAELITNGDAGRLLEFDALFIRETTAVSHHTYRLARKAEAAGLVVLDDPLSILRCTNKVYLAELLTRNKVPTPKTIVVHRCNWQSVIDEIGFPCVLKRPDSAFSIGVIQVKNPDELDKRLSEFFADSELVIAQEFMRTDFDWRIGVLDSRPVFACKYHMARGHWQIAKHAESSRTQFGKCETLPVELAPRKAVAVALKAANLIGDGLYGVDVKEIDGKYFVIEVNDNPNLDSGVEDAVLREELYRRIMESFVNRIERSKQPFISSNP